MINHYKWLSALERRLPRKRWQRTTEISIEQLEWLISEYHRLRKIEQQQQVEELIKVSEEMGAYE